MKQAANNGGLPMYQKLARFPPEDRRIIEGYGPYIMLIPFWVGFESYELGNFQSPYGEGVETQALDVDSKQPCGYKRRGHCPTCS